SSPESQQKTKTGESDREAQDDPLSFLFRDIGHCTASAAGDIRVESRCVRDASDGRSQFSDFMRLGLAKGRQPCCLDDPEALKGFTEITTADPNCAMAYWGIAMSHWYITRSC